jgi:ribosomal protein L37AE/L43A
MSVKNIACPNCKKNIPFDVKALMTGITFVCTTCGFEITLSAKRKEIAPKSIEELNRIKANALKNKA